MNLVAYSDSEASDEETPQPQPPAQKSTTASSKTNFQKVVDRSNPHKIRVNLPSAASTVAEEEQDEEERPAKKAHVGGGGLFSGLNSFLPAPKRSEEGTTIGADGTLGGGVGNRGLGKGLGRGVSLKTGAAPAFSREQPSMTEDYAMPLAGTVVETSNSKPSVASPIVEETEVKFVGKSTIFRPLSVARNTGKKKMKRTASSAQKSSTAQTTASDQPSVAAPPPKPKVSLFSMSREDDLPTVLPEPSYSMPGPADEYPLVDEEEQVSSALDEQPGYYEQPAPNHTAKPQSLDSLASGLDLDEATRRQLFGRRSKSTNAPINLVNFNTDQEYRANEELRATGETVQHNPVRGIMPGKHTLKQLVSAATTQKDALEESWAAGRRNKKEAGARYGF